MTADWAMVIITVIYVIATCAICYFNYQSAKATREQLAESKRQFDEENCAYITVTIDSILSGFIVLCVENQGKRIAKNVSIRVSSEFVENMKDKRAKELICKLCESSFTIGVKQRWYAFLSPDKDLDKLSNVPLSLQISYEDNIGKHEEALVIDLSQYYWALMYSSVEEGTRKEVERIAKSMESIDRKYSGME